MKQFKKRTKRIAAMFLALAMIVTSVPQYALAASAAEKTEDTEIVKEQVEAESNVEAETKVQAAEEPQKGNEQEVKEAEETQKGNETEVKEAEKPQKENEKDETDIDKESETVTEAEDTKASETAVEDEVSESDDVLKDDGDSDEGDTVEKKTVSFRIPYRETGTRYRSRKENLLEEFKYAIFETEQEDEVTLDKTYEGESSLDDMVTNGDNISIEVPIGNILYFEPILKEKCDLDAITVEYYDSKQNQEISKEITAENEIYKISIEEDNIDIDVKITAYRYFDVEFQGEGVKFYQSLEDIESETELTKTEVSEVKNTTFYVVPEGSKVVRTVDSNSTGISVKRNGKQPVELDDVKAYQYDITINNSGSFKDITTISAVAEEYNTYKATFEWSAADAEVFIGEYEDEDRVQLSETENEIDVTENDSLVICVKPKDSEKGVYVEYIDEVSKETIIPWEDRDYFAENGEEHLFWIEDISGDITVKISVVDIYDITLKTVNDYIYGGYYEYGAGEGDGEDFEFPSVDEEEWNQNKERECETKIQLPAGYELRFYVYAESEYGTVTVSAENAEITKRTYDGELYFLITPTADTTVIFDVTPEKFIVDADADVDFSISRYDDDTDEYVDIELDNNSIAYYNEREVRLKIKKEAGKRYDVKGEFDDDDGGTTIEDVDRYDDEDEDEYAFYDLNIGYCKKVFIRSYDLVTISFETDAEDSGLNRPRKFYRVKEDGKEHWEYESVDSDNKITADKDQDCFIGISYDFTSYKLEYISTTGDTGGNLEFYESYYADENFGREWLIYRLVPTADTTISIKISPLEDFTVTVIKGEGITQYYSLEGTIDEDKYVFENVTENSTFFLRGIDLEDRTNVLKVEYEVNDGTRRLVKKSYNSDDIEGYYIKITGNTTIHISALSMEEYTLKFDNMDGFDVKIWEAGSYFNFEEAELLQDSQITLENNKEYLFDIITKDAYIVENVISVDADGKETLVERNVDSNEANEGYCVGTGYGNTGDVTIRVNLKDAYRLCFDGESKNDLDIYSWEDHERERENRLNDQRIAVPAADSYSFYIPNYDALSYRMTIKENDSYTLTKDYRTFTDERDDGYRYTVYTVARKKDVTEPSATATIVIEPNDDTYTVTLSNESPTRIKSINLAYYSDANSDGYCEYYTVTDNQARVTNTVLNTVEVRPINGYTAKVTMTGESGTSDLELVRNEGGILTYVIGELTEDKTITVNVERTNVSTEYSVGFATRNAVVRDPKYKLPYIVGEYYVYGEYYECDYDCAYLVAKGDTISFIVEPEYGYKVESVSVYNNTITPDENGVYTVKPTREETGILVKTVEADNSDTPDDPNNPDTPDDPEKISTVTFTCPENVSVTINGVKPENNQYSVKTGEQISFEVTLADDTYEIKSVTVDGVEIPYDATTGTYTITITADTEIVITTGKKQEGTDPVGKYTVRFDYPQTVAVTAENLVNDQISDVEAGTVISFQVAVTNENFEITSVTANDVALEYNEAAQNYTVTINADTTVKITAAPKETTETNYPTQVSVKGVSKQQLTLSVQSSDYDITLTPSDADGSVLGVKVNPADSVIKALIVSETNGESTRYYLRLEKPEASVGDSAEITIYNILTGEAISGGTFTVITKAASTGEPDTSGLKVFFEDFDENETPSYTYTGSAITPSIEVTYNGEYLEEGTDYTVKFANNVNVSTSAKPAKLTITGKGSLSGKHDYTFQITKKNIADLDVQAGSVKVVANAKATPILAYNGMVLGKKDFNNPDASKKFIANGTITLTGAGNYEGTRIVNVEVVDKSQLNKISLQLDNAQNKNLSYDGTDKYPAFKVLDSKKVDITDKKDTAYLVVYPEDIASAGTVKFTVIGIGDYTGSVTKTYKIKPSAKTESDITVSDPYSAGYTFVSTGVTEYDPDVRLKDGTWLEKGRDYTLAYSNNKKAGTAKCKINFIGNYKGVKAITKEFKINQFNIADFYEENIIITDKTSGGKPGIYKSVPYIIDNEADALVKSSEFKFTYYTDAAMTTEMKDKLTSGKVWVKIEPKNAAKGNYTGACKVSYTIRENGTDLSKAKITFNPNKLPYTGSPLTPECFVDNTSIKGNDKYDVRYLSNVTKGKATVIVSGAADSEYVGGKTATFTITASDIK